MKTIKTTFAILIITIFTFSCSNNDEVLSPATAIWRTGTCASTTSGTLTITALSATEISGTFSFTGKRTSSCSDPAKQITEGSFKSQITP